ncbi:MAG: hypothetical protein NC179_05935, partial [[Eubacterium] siraeum]|nr:hypothetical protein [[Eubacterium] siraeum]
LLMLPFLISYGAVSHAHTGHFFGYFGLTILSSFLPFFIANIIAVPVMKLMNKVKNRFIIVLIITILLICGVFIFYLTSLSTFLNYLRREGETLTSSGTLEYFRRFANAAYPFRLYADVAGGQMFSGLSSGQLALRYLYIFLINAALGVIAYFITTREYYKTILYGIETEKASFKKNVKDKQRSAPWALFRREFYLILRSFNYSFQYFAMACAAPVMVFFCNRLAASMGAESLGSNIMPGLTLMVIIIFVTIVVSFASTSISREGNCFYHTKIIPVTYTTQTLVKFALYASVATLSVALCCMVSGIYYTTDAGDHMLKATDVLAIFAISEIIVVSLTSLFMLIDIKSPTFNVAGDGELVSANKNVALAMVVGFAVAILYGVFAMIFSFIPIKIGSWQISALDGDIGGVYVILLLISLVLLGASLSALFVNLNRKYHRIIP